MKKSSVYCPYGCGERFSTANSLEKHIQKCSRRSKNRFVKFFRRKKDME